MGIFRVLGRPEESVVSPGSEATTYCKQYPSFVLEPSSVAANSFQALKIPIY